MPQLNNSSSSVAYSWANPWAKCTIDSGAVSIFIPKWSSFHEHLLNEDIAIEKFILFFEKSQIFCEIWLSWKQEHGETQKPLWMKIIRSDIYGLLRSQLSATRKSLSPSWWCCICSLSACLLETTNGCQQAFKTECAALASSFHHSPPPPQSIKAFHFSHAASSSTFSVEADRAKKY